LHRYIYQCATVSQREEPLHPTPPIHPPPPGLSNAPVGGGGVGPALQGPGGGGSQGVRDDEGHGGGGVGLGDGDLLGLGRLLAAVRAEAVALQHGGARPVEAVRDAGVRLALHEGPLGHDKNKVKSGRRLK